LRRFAVVPAVGVEKGSFLAFGMVHDSSIQDGLELSDIIAMCSGHDQRQRDATPVHQQVSLGAFFSPDLLDWVPLLRSPSVT
jgi:hypothetical protein